MSDLTPSPGFSAPDYPTDWEALNSLALQKGYTNRIADLEARLEDLEEQVRFLRREILIQGGNI
jgi:hypothetical protein